MFAFGRLSPTPAAEGLPRNSLRCALPDRFDDERIGAQRGMVAMLFSVADGCNENFPGVLCRETRQAGE